MINFTIYKIGAIKDANDEMIGWFDREDGILEVNGFAPIPNVADDDMACDIVADLLGNTLATDEVGVEEITDLLALAIKHAERELAKEAEEAELAKMLETAEEDLATLEMELV